MNMQKTILARRANNLTKGIGKHFTVQKVVNDGDKHFGFAVDDEGNSAFIPRPVILKHNMTPEDEGAGFTAPTREPALNAGADGSPQITLPLVWDGEAEEIVVEESESRDYDAEIDGLLEKIEGLLKLQDTVDGLIQNNIRIKEMAENHQQVATFIHNELTEIAEWVEENYPSEGETDAV
jgi:hypothetical protein